MRRFAQLCQALDAANATANVDADADTLRALAAYLADAPPADAAWALYFLLGGRLRQVVPSTLLRRTACAQAGIPAWLFETCQQEVGDLAETIAQVLPPPTRPGDAGLAEWVERRLLCWRGLPPAELQARLVEAWDELDAAGRFVLVKLAGGGWRPGVDPQQVQRALAGHAGLDPRLLAQRLVGWAEARATPTTARYLALLAPADTAGPATGEPYPLVPARPLPVGADPGAEMPGEVAHWWVEWQYGGLRAQIVKRGGRVWLWSLGEELITERFPEVVAQAAGLPEGTVLDGELLVWPPGELRPAAFHRLQQRLTRRTPTRLMLEATPVAFLASDLLEAGGQDRRDEPQEARRARLEALLDGHQRLRPSPRVQAPDWPGYAALRMQARERGAHGLLLKHCRGRYGTRCSEADGAWWVCRVDPCRVDAVLIYAQAGPGWHAGASGVYTFALWNRPPAGADEVQAVVDAILRREPAREGALQLLPVAKVGAGLGDAEREALEQVVRATTLEKFGPVRSLQPTLVAELGFEDVAASARHKSGVLLRQPSILGLRPGMPLHEAGHLGMLRALIPGG